MYYNSSVVQYKGDRAGLATFIILKKEYLCLS